MLPVRITDLYPTKAQFQPGSQLSFKLETSGDVQGYQARVIVSHLHQPVYSQIFELGSENKTVLTLDTTLTQSTGFGVEVELLDAQNQVIDSKQTAFDLAEHWKEAPRYGFLCEFGSDQLGKMENVEFLQKLHLNVVQFYDWMYRHDKLVPENETFTDPLGRTMSLDVIREKIQALHDRGMKAIAYGAIYAALEDFLAEHPDWGLYQNDGQPYSLADIFYIMDISPGSAWNEHIINEYKQVIELGFDGIHLDQYGFPKKALSKEGTVVDLSHCFTPFINQVKGELREVNPDVGLIFNNVTDFPTYATGSAEQEAVYIEVWSPINDYRDLKTLIDKAKFHAGEKQVILAAYLPSFGAGSIYSQNEAEKGALITMAAIFANGAYHLLIGEDRKVLTEGYYPNYGKMSPEFTRRVRSYYDFIVRYRELLFSSELLDLTFTHCGGYNTEIGRDNEFEFEKEGGTFAPHGKLDTVWTIVKENQDYVVVNLVNLLDIGNDLWNAGKQQGTTLEQITVKGLVVEGVSQVYYASPDINDGKCIELPMRSYKSTNGYMVEVEVPKLDVWGMLYFVKAKDR